MEHFLASFDTMVAGEFVEFFPRAGDFVYRNTIHASSGDEISVRTFRPAEIPAALEDEEALRESFQLDHHGQPIGLLVHRVRMSEGRWRRVGESRFVPPDADSPSPTYVEWRMEGPRWVIAEMGDERFRDVPLPPWCC